MGTIQNAINSTVGEVLKVGAVATTAGAIRAGEQAKGLQEKSDIETMADIEKKDLQNATEQVQGAEAEAEKYNNLVKETEAEKERGMYFGNGPDAFEKEAEWNMEKESELNDSIQRRNVALDNAKKLQDALKLQRDSYDKRMEILTARAEAFNKTARQRGIKKIDMEELKGGKK